MSTKIAILTVQKWGNSLAVRIPSAIARHAHFHLGTLVELAVQEGVIVVKPKRDAKMTLQQRLEMFDLKKHGGEVMASEPVGLEKF